MSLVAQGAEERARVLAGMFEQCPKTGGFLLSPKKRIVTGTFKPSVLSNHNIALEFCADDGTVHRSTWRHDGNYTIDLLHCSIVHRFSGDPGGSTTPIGIPNSLELMPDEIREINNEFFYTEP